MRVGGYLEILPNLTKRGWVGVRRSYVRFAGQKIFGFYWRNSLKNVVKIATEYIKSGKNRLRRVQKHFNEIYFAVKFWWQEFRISNLTKKFYQAVRGGWVGTSKSYQAGRGWVGTLKPSKIVLRNIMWTFPNGNPSWKRTFLEIFIKIDVTFSKLNIFR